MIPGFGKQTITIGSAPQCDLVLAGQGIAPEHARITHQGGGKLLLIPAAAGTVVGDRQLNPGENAPFDFRTQFYIHQVPIPLSHPSLTLMLLAKGQVVAPPGQIIIGRDPARASIVLQHPSVSSQHATIVLDRMMVIDHNSTSGTFVGKSRIPGGTPTPVDPNGIVAFGPVPVQVGLLGQLAQAIAGGAPVAADPAPGSMAGGPRPAAPGTAALPSTGGHPIAQHLPPAAPYPSGAHAQASGPHAQPSGAHAAPVMAGAGIQHGPVGAPAPAAGPGQPGTVAMPVGGGAPAAAAGQPGTSLMQMGGPSGGFAAAAAGSTPRKKNKTVLGHLEFSAGQQPVKTIGRTPDNNIVLNHAQVSSRHALLHQIDGRFFLEDRGSANGTYVRGQRIPSGQKIAVQSGEKIYIGPMPLQIELSGSGAADIVQEEFAPDRWAGKPLYEIEAWSLVLQVPDRDNPREMKTLLDDVSFKALPGDMIALMGPSGAGKTTLLLALNGYLPPSSGMVRINGEDLYNIYDNLRGSIGYVPQDDLVHPELTVFEAVRYSAKFRLPPDYTDAEIDARVEQTIRDLGLEGVKNLQIGKPEKKILSGGQRKRVNIALELVTDPVILFLDEPTSGLAADDTTALITLLADLTKATGKTIIMTIHQPAKDEFEKFNNCLIMGYGGVPMFFGPSKEAYGYFGRQKARSGQQNDIDNPRDMFEMIAQRERPIYEALLAQNPNASRGQARQLAAVEWRKEFYQPDNPIFRKMYSGRREVGTGQGQRGIPATRAKTSGQLRLLLSRYFKVKIRDTWGTVIMLAQAPIIGVLLAIVFGGQKDAIPAWCLGALQELSSRAGEKDGNTDILAGVSPTSDNTGAIFFLVVAAVWFGTSNAAREIVSERAIYLRERMVNLGLVNYVLSKYLLLAMFCIVQCAVLLGIVFFTLKFHGGWNAFALQLAALTATAFVAVAIGLLISTLVESSEAAMALTPIALIPQVVLGGLIVPSTTIPHLAPLMYAIPARWGFEGAVTPEKVEVAGDPSWSIEIGDPTVSSPPDFVENGVFDCSIAQLASDNFAGGWGFTTYDKPWVPYAVLGGMAVVAMILLCIILKRRDPV